VHRWRQPSSSPDSRSQGCGDRALLDPEPLRRSRDPHAAWISDEGEVGAAQPFFVNNASPATTHRVEGAAVRGVSAVRELSVRDTIEDYETG
jgi:hypothetical protein